METKQQESPHHVAALFDTQADADAAVAELEREHFPRERIGLAIPSDSRPEAAKGRESADPGTRTAVLTGTPGAGYPGWTMGMAPWAFPGVGPVVVFGSIARAKKPDGPDDLRTFIMSLGLHEDIYGHLESRFKGGSILVGVEAHGNEAIAKNILERNGGHALRRRHE